MNYFQNYFDSPASSLACYFLTRYPTQPMEKCKTNTSTFSLEKLRLLCLLSLFLFAGYQTKAQQSCANPQSVQPGFEYNGSTSGNSNYDGYFANGTEVISGTEGPEAFYFIEWEVGELEITLTDFSVNTDIILLSECNNTSVIAGSTNENIPSKTVKVMPAPGTYYIIVDSRESAGTSFKLSVKQTIPPLPDYHAISLTGPSSASTGESITVRATVRNGGGAVATDEELAGALDRFFLSFNDGGATPARELKAVPTRKLQVGEEIQIEESLQIPSDIPPGNNYRLVYFADNSRTITELEQLPNVAFHSPFSVESASLNCDNAISFSPLDQPQSGPLNGTNNVELYCGNTTPQTAGEVVYEVVWPGGDFTATLDIAEILWDGIQLTPDLNLALLADCTDPNTCVGSSFNANSASNTQEEITVSNLAAGTYYLVVDGRDGFPDMNYTLTLGGGAKPDYRTFDSKINNQVGLEVAQGEQVTLSFGVKNFGLAPGASLTQAKYYYSADITLDGGDQLLGAQEIEILVPNQHTRRSIDNVRIPQNAQVGTRYILVKADADDDIAESDEDNNVEAVAMTVVNSEKPDYQPTSLSGPTTATAGQAVLMDISLKNNGSVDGNGNGGKDRYYISANPNLNASNLTANATLLVEYDTDYIPAGVENDYQGGFNIPSDLTAGTYYIYFFHDADDKIAEEDETNNIIKHQITIETGEPDYVPLDFKLDGQTSLTVSRGQRVSGSLFAQNQGFGAGTVHTDGKYYYSPDANFNAATDLYLGEANDIEPLVGGRGTPEFESIKIPESAQLGTGYIFYWLDASQTIAESNEDNNVASVMLNVTAASTQAEVNFTASSTNPCEGTSITFSSTSTGGNTVLDQSTNEHDGTLMNGTDPLIDGRSGFGKALNLPTTEDYVMIGDLGSVENWTIETWFKPNGVSNYENLFHSEDEGTNRGIRLEMSANNPLRIYFNGQSIPVLNGANSLSSEWHHLAIVGDQSSNRIIVYLDGEQKTTGTPSSWMSSFPNFVLGRGYRTTNDAGRNRNYKGSFDEFRVWNGVRTEAEIFANKDSELAGNEAGLLAYYNFNQPLSGGNTTYSWSFPGGTPSTSTEANPTVAYPNGGSYNVSLTVNGNTETKSNFITVENCDVDATTLEVDFIANKTEVCVGESVQFTSIVSIGDANQVPDRSGNGNNGDLKGFDETIYTENAGYGKALSFDGTDDYIDAGDIMPKSYTKEVWINMSAANGLNSNLISGNSSHAFWVPSGHVSAGHNGAWSTVRDDNPIATGWQHYAVTYDETSRIMKLFKNGVKIKEATNVAPMNPDTERVLVGSYSGGSLFKGDLDEVRVWDKARTEEEIASAWNQELTGNETGLLVYYDFNPTLPNGLTYTWGFPGGSPANSNEANPTVTYSTPGTYNVALMITNGDNIYIEPKEAYITVESCGPNWPVVETGDNHTVTIQKDDFVVNLANGQNISVGDYLGAFYSDNGTLKCAGKIEWRDQNTAVVVYGDDPILNGKEGFAVGETFQWKLWKASSNEEIDVVATYQQPLEIVTHTGEFAINGVSKIKTLTEGSLEQTQTLTLEPGWNLISSYIRPTAPDMANIFSAISDRVSIVKDEVGTAYIPSSSINNIGSWQIEEGYQLRVSGSTPVSLEIRGIKVNPATIDIPLSQGWNLVPYLRESEQSIATAMNPVSSDIHIVKDVSGQIYMPILGINNIGNMKPGRAYWAKMKADVNLNYTARMASPPANMYTAQLMPAQYRIKRQGTHNATMILDTKDLVAYGDEVGVFDKAGNLVGAATYEDHILAFSIWGDDPTTDAIDGLEEGDEFEIRVWEHATATEKVYVFNANVDIYTTYGVIEAELLRTTNVPSLLEANSLKLYPNPTRNQVTLSLNLKSQATVKVVLFDLTGKQVLRIPTENQTSGNHEWKLNTASLPSGLYHCKVLVDGITHNIPFSVVK